MLSFEADIDFAIDVSDSQKQRAYRRLEYHASRLTSELYRVFADDYIDAETVIGMHVVGLGIMEDAASNYSFILTIVDADGDMFKMKVSGTLNSSTFRIDKHDYLYGYVPPSQKPDPGWSFPHDIRT